MDQAILGALLEGSALPQLPGATWHSQQAPSVSPVGAALSRRETLVEETTAESSEEEAVAPSQVTARERAGGLRGLGAGALGPAPTHLPLPGALGGVLSVWSQALSFLEAP